jgi:hypothetical protein
MGTMLMAGFWGSTAPAVLPTGRLVGAVFFGAHCDEIPSVQCRARYAKASTAEKALLETESDYSVN